MSSSVVFRLTRWTAVSAAVLTAIAMLTYPGGTARDPSARGYSFFQNSLSDLGSTVSWGGEANPVGAFLFVSGSSVLALAGVGCIGVLVRLYSSSRTTRAAAWAAAAAGALSCAGLLGAALTPQDRNPSLHGGWSLLALGALVALTLLFALATALNACFPRRVSLGWLALTSVLVAWISVMSWRPTTDLELAIPVTLQKAVGIAVVVTVLFQTYEAERVLAGAGEPGNEPHKRLG